MDFDSFLANVNQQYNLSLAPGDLDQQSSLFKSFHPGFKELESFSRRRFNAAMRSNSTCSELFDEYLQCQREFHNFIARYGAQGEDYLPYLSNLRELRVEIADCFPIQ